MRTSRVDVVHEAAEAEQVEIRLLADDIRDHLHGAHHHPQSQDLDGYELCILFEDASSGQLSKRENSKFQPVIQMCCRLRELSPATPQPRDHLLNHLYMASSKSTLKGRRQAKKKKMTAMSMTTTWRRERMTAGLSAVVVAVVVAEEETCCCCKGTKHL